MPRHIDRIRLLEDLGADAWPAATAERLQGWRLCLDAGVTRRANSVLPNAATPVNDAETLIDEVERRYQARGLMPCFKLTVAAQPADLDDRLGRRGYRAEGHSLVLTGDAGEGTLHAPHDAISLHDRPRPDLARRLLAGSVLRRRARGPAGDRRADTAAARVRARLRRRRPGGRGPGGRRSMAGPA